MPSSRKVRLSAEAEDDVRSILQYSLQMWGPSQRDAYQLAFHERLADLATYPLLGQPREEIFPGCRTLSIRRHIAYYLVANEAVLIVRILHERRDPGQARLTRSGED